MEDSLVLSSAIIKSSFRLSFLYWRTNILFSLSSQSIFCRAEGACYVAACPVWRALRTAQRCSPHSLLSHHHILSVANPWCTQSQVLSASTAVVIPQKWKCREPLQGEKKKKIKEVVNPSGTTAATGKKRDRKETIPPHWLLLIRDQTPHTHRLTGRAEGAGTPKPHYII